MFHKRQQRLGFFAAAMASAAIVVATAAAPAGAAEGPNDVQSCQLGPNGQNPCPEAGPDQQKTEAELCTLGYGPNGKLQCVDDSGAPDDFKSCEPEKQNPDVDPCNHGGGGEGEGNGEGGGGEGGGENPGDGGDGDGGGEGEPENPGGEPENPGGEPENPGGGQNQHKPQIYPPDPHKPDTGGGKEPLKLTGGIPVPTRIDTGAGGTARSTAWPLLLAPAVILMATAVRTATVVSDLVVADEDR